MESLYKIRIVYEPYSSGVDWVDAVMPTLIEEEIVMVEAQSLEQAAKRAMLYSTISPGGRLVSYYDELGELVIPEYDDGEVETRR